MVRPVFFNVKSFLGLAKVRDVKRLYETYYELYDEIFALKEFLNIDSEKKLVQKKSVYDEVIETMEHLSPILTDIMQKKDSTSKDKK